MDGRVLDRLDDGAVAGAGGAGCHLGPNAVKPSELLLVLTIALVVAGLALLVLHFGWVGAAMSAALAVSLGTLAAVAVPHTSHRWDLPNLLSQRAWDRLTEARIRRGWGGFWGGDDRSV